MPIGGVRLATVEAALGWAVSELTEEVVRDLVDASAREDTDLEFKGELYGTSDSEKRDLSGDVAAIATAIGGVIIIGVGAVDGVATSVAPVLLSEDEELRMRQIVMSGVVPVPQFSILPVPIAGTGTGCYGILVPRSREKPHAVRVGTGFRFPIRQGPQIRYLTESEVAAAYRSRFTSDRDREERLLEVMSDGLASVARDDNAWLSMALVPVSGGEFRISRESQRALGEWSQQYSGGFPADVLSASRITTGLRRVVFRQPGREGLRSVLGHAEFHVDGSSFVALPMAFAARDSSGRPMPDTPEGDLLADDERLVLAVLAFLSVGVDFASRIAHATGDALVRFDLGGIASEDGRLQHPIRLTQSRRFGLVDRRSEVSASRLATSLQTVDLNAAASATTDLMVASRLVLSDLFNALGVAEVEQIDEGGRFRARYFRSEWRVNMTEWADAHGVEISEVTLD